MPREISAGGKSKPPVPPVKPLLKTAQPAQLTPQAVQGLLPQVSPGFINTWMGGGGTVTVSNPQVTGWNRSTGRAVYNYPGLNVPGQTQGPMGSGFGNIARAPSPGQNPIFVTGMNREQLAGNLLHEMYHAFQRQRPYLRLTMAAEMLGGQPPGEAAAFRLSNRQVSWNREDWLRYIGFLRP